MKKTVFIDGQHGTTGLKINERLNTRTDIELIEIPEENRKDPKAKEKLLNEADIVFLCLPDDAARESVSLIKNKAVCVIDGSTAHRVTEGWVYGLPELKKEQRGLIKNSKRITVPGCHATGFIADAISTSSSGHCRRGLPSYLPYYRRLSGGGKSMIAEYQGENVPDYIKNPRPYALTLNHKHVPEMKKIIGLVHPPLFTPTVVNVYNGEIISIPLFVRQLKKKLSAAEIRAFLGGLLYRRAIYQGDALSGRQLPEKRLYDFHGL